jgi:nicotinate-nucleotide pyrophosphorylase
MTKKPFEFEITVEANSKAEAETKMKALAVMVSRLTPEELSKLAHIIKNDPAKTTLAKKYLGV